MSSHVIIRTKNKIREHAKGTEKERLRKGCVSYSMFRKNILSRAMFQQRLEERLSEIWEGKVVQPDGTGNTKP